MLCVVMMLSITSGMVFGADTIGAPAHFGVSHYQGDYFYYTMTVPDDLRTIIENRDPNNRPIIKAQIDYKLGDGNWHYTSAWDTAKMNLKNSMGVSYVRGESYISSGRDGLTNWFPDDAALLKPIKDSGWNMPDQALSFRARLVTSLDGNKTFVYSDWSDTYVYAKGVVEDPDALINHAPTLTTCTIEKNSGGMPFLKLMTGRLPGEVQDLNSMVAGAVRTEIWMRKTGETDFKLINSSFFSNEYIWIGVDDYFDKAKQSYDAEGYEIKIRYALNNLNKYPQCGRSDIIYSPFSNVFSQNMPAWSDASKWATGALTKADDYGLIPDILTGADMTKIITREEFAELAVLLYEKTTNTKSTPFSPNPFTDTTNPQILKAFKIGTTAGTSKTEFSPEVLINREQCATMLFNTIKAIKPQGDFSIDGVKDFPDQKDISKWALSGVKYMSKMGIITGDAKGNFMPKSTTTAQQAAKYGMATREQAISMSVKTFENLK